MKSLLHIGAASLALAGIWLADDARSEPRKLMAQGDTAQAAAQKQFVEIVNAAGKSTHIDANTLKGLPRRKLEIQDTGGKPAQYEGVTLATLLDHGGIKIENSLRGERLANYLLVEAKDGYRVVFALPEVDPNMTDNVVLFVDTRDGKALDDKEGPFRILVPHEKQHPRWIRQVVRISEKFAPGK